MTLIHALCVGGSIADQLAADQDLKLIGQTSRGCFLQTKTEYAWTVFLSEETYRGPLTINLAAGTMTQIQQTTGQTIPLFQNILYFSDQVQLTLQNALHWLTPPPVNSARHFSIRQKTITQAIYMIQERKSKNELTGILPDLLPMLAVSSLPSSTGGQFTEKLSAIITALQSSDTADLLNCLAALLGQGSGLTPSGDDFLMGFFLAFNRWGGNLPHAKLAQAQGRQIAEKARRQTTHLSANLIECAIQGQADERLIHALDGLMTNEKSDLEWLDGLLNWGNSSGLDAFAGMILANHWQMIRL